MFELIKQFFAKDPTTATLITSISLSFLTGFLYLLRDVIKSFFLFIVNHFFISVSVDNSTVLYYNIINVLIKNKKSFLKRVDITSNSFDLVSDYVRITSHNAKKNLGSFSSIVFYKFIPFFVSSIEVRSDYKLVNKYIIKISTFFIFKKILTNLIDQALINELHDGIVSEDDYYLTNFKTCNYFDFFRKKYSIYKDISYQGNFFNILNVFDIGYGVFYSDTKSFNDLILPKLLKESLVDRISKFLNSYEKYKKEHISYHLGILLHGIPGSGKTSIIKAISNYFGFVIYKVSINRINELLEFLHNYKRYLIVTKKNIFLRKIKSKFKNNYKNYFNFFNISDKLIENIDEYLNDAPITNEEFNKLEEESEKELVNFLLENKLIPLIVLEDIDSSLLFTERSHVEKKLDKSKEEVKGGKSYFSANTMSDLLNSIDGIVSNEFFIIIGTTNKLERIDSAFKRPGRFDLVLEIPPVDQETFRSFCTKYYPNYQLPKNIKVKPNISTSFLQEEYLKGSTIDELCDKFLEKKK